MISRRAASRLEVGVTGLFVLGALLACRVPLDAEVPFGPEGEPSGKVPPLLPKGSALPPDAREVALIEVSAVPEVQTFGNYDVTDECKSVREAMVGDILNRATRLGCSSVVELSTLCTPRVARLRGICIHTKSALGQSPVEASASSR